MKDGTILIIPDKPDEERDALAEVWEKKYGEVMRVGKFWIKPETNGKNVALYGYDSFCLVLAQIMNLEMISPKDEWIAILDYPWIKREIDIKEISQIDEIVFPKFIKPTIPKLFKGQIYTSKNALLEAITDIKEDEKLIISSILAVDKEVRVFVLDRKIQDLAFYEGEGELEDAQIFATNFLKNTDLDLPKTFVMDLGYNKNEGWFIVEFNSSWGAGLNFCKPEKVIDCIKEATKNLNTV
jgi:ATP-grasp domain, R2K clade family 2